jgi:hypothetical protein
LLEDYKLNLYSDDFQTPLWKEHPRLGAQCDVVALPFERPDRAIGHHPANLYSGIKVGVRPGTTVFIVGFPHRIFTGVGFPIMKSGYIASEPEFGIALDAEFDARQQQLSGIELPAIFIDSLTRSGMSGSPVFAYRSGTWNYESPYEPVTVAQLMKHHGPPYLEAFEFLGVYSGRVPDRQDGAALGLCWPLSVIEQVCASIVPARHPHR